MSVSNSTTDGSLRVGGSNVPGVFGTHSGNYPAIGYNFDLNYGENKIVTDISHKLLFGTSGFVFSYAGSNTAGTSNSWTNVATISPAGNATFAGTISAASGGFVTTGTTSGNVSIRSSTGTYTLTLPVSAGGTDEILHTDGSGNTYWASYGWATSDVNKKDIHKTWKSNDGVDMIGFTWKTGDTKTFHYGYQAQQIEKNSELAGMVTSFPDASMPSGITKRVNYTELLVYKLQKMQEKQTLLEEQQKKSAGDITELRKLVLELQQKLNEKK